MADRGMPAMRLERGWTGVCGGRALLVGLIALVCLAGAGGQARAALTESTSPLDAPLRNPASTPFTSPASLSMTASISGIVSDSDGHAITTQDICVSAEPMGGGYSYGEATTGASGEYTITDLSAGSYDVYVSDCYGSSRNDAPGYYESNGSKAAVELTAGQAATGIDVQLGAATSISGHVYGGAGASTPLSDACVEVSDADSSYQDDVGYATTESDGAYTVDHLTPGAGYKVQFSPCSSGTAYADEFYDEEGSFADAATVTPTVANPSTGIDGHLPSGASISGTVTDASGDPITTADVCVYASPYGGNRYGNTTTNASGEYTITGLAAGSYYLEFADCGSSARNDVTQYYGGAPDENDSTLVVLSTGGAKTGVNAELAAGTSISGHAYAGSGTGTPVANQCVYVEARSPSGTADDYYYSYYGETNSSGEYTIHHVAPISTGYTVEFRDCNNPVTYVSQYYGGDYDPSTASAVTPTVASPAQAVDAHLETGGTITGTVTDSKGNAIGSGVCVEAGLTNDGYVYYEEYGDGLTSGGSYTVGGLPTGSYDVTFYDCGSRNDVSQTLPSPVSVTVGEPTEGVDASMQPATKISGHVYGGAGAGTPLDGICVEAFSSDGAYIGGYDTGNAYTGTDGSYTLEHLDPSGSYVVEFNTCSYDGSNDYATQYYDGVSELSQADVLTPTLTVPSTGIDAHLPSGAPVTTITGGPAANAATSQTDARFSFTADAAGATFECALDGGAYTPCTSPYDTGALPVGKHTFTVEASADGETETKPRYITWTIDPSSPTSTSQGQVTSGGTFSSDPGGETSSVTPVIVSVTPPSSSQVTLTTEPTTTPSGNGYTIFGEQVDIAAAEPGGAGTVTGTVNEPIKLDFTLDASQIPAGTDPSSVTVTRNGTPAANCVAINGTASPDPCVESRTATGDGGVEIVVLTTHCSTWNFATPAPEQPPGSTGQESGGGSSTGTGGNTSPAGGGPAGGSSTPSGGVGSVTTRPAAPTVPLTRTQELAKALKVCKKVKSKSKRKTCEATAKKRYGPKPKKKAKPKKKG
jgi:hypothetical protein